MERFREYMHFIGFVDISRNVTQSTLATMPSTDTKF